MLKKLLPSLLLIGSAATSSAQTPPTLTEANFSPVVGENFLLKVCATSGVLYGSSGANQTWDFTGLTTTSTEVGKVVSCLSTAHCSSYPGSTFATIAPNPAHVTTYLSSSATKLVQYGVWQAVDTNLILSDPIEQIRYPFTYTNTYTDNYAGILTFGPLTAHENGTVAVTADAYGVLQLPGRTDSALRIHTVQAFTDSTYLFGSPVVENFMFETYAWYKPGYHTALLTISTVTNVSTSTEVSKFVAYAPKEITKVTPVENLSFELYPNPATNQLNIRLNLAGSEEVSISLIDMLGREKTTINGRYSGAQNIVCDTRSLQKGIYIVRIQSREETVTRKIEIQ